MLLLAVFLGIALVVLLALALIAKLAWIAVIVVAIVLVCVLLARYVGPRRRVRTGRRRLF